MRLTNAIFILFNLASLAFIGTVFYEINFIEPNYDDNGWGTAIVLIYSFIVVGVITVLLFIETILILCLQACRNWFLIINICLSIVTITFEYAIFNLKI